MSTEELKDLQASINKKGYGWQAVATNVSVLSAEQQKALFDLHVGEKEMKATAQAMAAWTASSIYSRTRSDRATRDSNRITLHHGRFSFL